MKKFIVALTLLVSTGALAAGGSNPGSADENSSWDEIQMTSNLRVEDPQIGFRGVSGTWRIGVVDVCIAENGMFKTKNRINVEECRDTAGDHRVCDSLPAQHLYAGRTTVKERCVQEAGDTCHRWEQYTYTHPLSYNIEVVEELAGDNERTAFYKDYTITECR